jgi:hypothetical protein
MGISNPYENDDLDLFIMKKLLLEHKQRDDAGFFAKEFSFNNNSLEDICRVINRFMEDKILYLSGNTRPESFEEENIEGLIRKDGFINWELVRKLDDSPEKMDNLEGCVSFDTDVIDEVKLKGRLDIAIEEFMSDRGYNVLGRQSDIKEVEKMAKDIKESTSYKDEAERKLIYDHLVPKIIYYPYKKQREVVINEVIKDTSDERRIDLNNYSDPKVDMLKTLLALEKEGMLRIKELGNVPMFDFDSDKGFTGQWSAKDTPFARIQIIKSPSNRQEPIPIRIIGDIGIKGFEEKVILQKPKNKRIRLQNFPADTKWEDITIKFLNAHEAIITVKKETFHSSFEEMGFQDEKRKLPNKQWEFLRGLSETGGQLSWRSPKASTKGKKQKQLLADTLKAYFQIKEDPFCSYREEKSYKIKIHLIPESNE